MKAAQIGRVVLQRVHSDAQSTLGRLVIDGREWCWTLEPGPNEAAHPAIPAGTYVLRFRTGSPKDSAYVNRYGRSWHKGMIEIVVPGRTAIEFHVGNYAHQTLGCTMPGLAYQTPDYSEDGHYAVLNSRKAYELVYPLLRDGVLAGGAAWTVCDAKGAVQ